METNPTDEAITVTDTARAALRVLAEAEAHLGISYDSKAALRTRLDKVLKAALPGGLDAKQYAALHILRSAADFDDEFSPDFAEPPRKN